ncbi:MAG: hypothetical protein LBS99_05420 [Clostridiales bacterium]|jgi:hypothetical protein|nr:hypothetical protein [Clostridiales bacterium]
MSVMKRYAVVREKYPREVVLLKSLGCAWNKCAFCDYKNDKAESILECIPFNRQILNKARGGTGVLQIIDSASFNELPMDTLFDIIETCAAKKISTVILEQHWIFRDSFSKIKALFAAHSIGCKFILGLETFDYNFRENVLRKGMGNPSPRELSRYFQWANLLCGAEGQTVGSVENDIRLGLEHFERITVNMFIPNSTVFKRDNALIAEFYNGELFRQIRLEPRVEILDILDARAPDLLGGVGYAEGADNA